LFVSQFLLRAVVTFLSVPALLATVVLVLENDCRPDDFRTTSIAPQSILDPDHGSSFPETSQ
jgi:hypothetical protein